MTICGTDGGFRSLPEEASEVLVLPLPVQEVQEQRTAYQSGYDPDGKTSRKQPDQGVAQKDHHPPYGGRRRIRIC